MSKRSTLCIMLVILIIADIAVGKSMLSAYGSSGNAVTEEGNENGCDEGQDEGQKETSELQENGMEADELEKTEMDLSGVKIDITADEVPCILGNPSEDLYSVDDDNVLSIYQNNYSKLLTCPVFTGDGCTFFLKRKFSKLKFRLGQWEAASEDSASISIYKGKTAKESALLLRIQRKPGQRDKTYSVDVSDCNFVTIQTESGCYAPTTLVTNGFKVVYK